MQIIKHSLLAGLTSIVALSGAKAQTATTDPVGFVTTTIAASPNGSSWTTTPISPVLLQASGVNGTAVGSISAVTADSISLASPGWVAGELASSSAYVLFKSGALEGLILRVTANTTTTATLDVSGASLVTLGAQSGNNVQLVQGDTLLSMFGTTADGVVGGDATAYTAGQTDRVNIKDSLGVVRTYYYNTQFNQWRRPGTSADQGSVPISPLSGAFYFRIGQTALTMTTTGGVPVTSVKYLVPTSGLTFFGRFFPTAGTINSFGFQNLPGWVVGSTGDRVNTTDSAGVVRSYFWNGSQWRRTGTSADQSATSVPIGGAVSVNRVGSGPAQLLTVALPYTL
jgi:hypothetical protein